MSSKEFPLNFTMISANMTDINSFVWAVITYHHAFVANHASRFQDLGSGQVLTALSSSVPGFGGTPVSLEMISIIMLSAKLV